VHHDYDNRRIFWITGKVIMARKLSGFSKELCISVESEPLALTLDVEKKYLYWMTFNNEDNTVWLNQLDYTTEGCGTNAVPVELPGSLFASSSRGVLTYGLGTLYLTTISTSSQSIYVFPADFASFTSIIGDSVKMAFGVIPQADVVRAVCVVSEILQPLPDGLVATGLSNVGAGQLSYAPRLRENESSTSVIVIEWGVSSTNIPNSILYEVEYNLTPFRQPAMDPAKTFTTDTFIRLEDQTFFTEVNVTVTPHTLWLESNDSLSVTSVFSSPPRAPGKVMNVKAYVFRPSLENDNDITALIVWDPLDEVDAGGTVSHYSVNISDGSANLELTTMENESYVIVREFSNFNVLSYPLKNNEMYNVQVSAVNSGGTGVSSDSITLSTNDVSPPQELLAVTSGQSFLYGGSGVGATYVAVHPVAVNTISRLMYWYNSTINSILMQSLDGDTISVFLKDTPINVSTMAFEWQGKRLYMAGENLTTNLFELWRVPVVYSKNIESVHTILDPVKSLTNLVVDSFRRGRAYWLQENNDGNVSLELLHLGSDVQQQETVNLSNLTVSALTLEPHTGDLWVSNKTNGKILRCPWSSGACEEVVNTDMMVTSITQDESMIYWTNGSVIASVDVAESSTPNVWIPFEDCKIISIHTLSPGQQPQYYQCPSEDFTTCLAPDTRFSGQDSLPTPSTRITNTTIEVSWSLPPIINCCLNTVFSYPLVQYNYALDDGNCFNPEDPFQRHLKYDNLQPFSSYRISLVMHNIYTVTEPERLLFIAGIRTDEGVPDPVATLSAVGSGVTCIDVFWSGPDNLRGSIGNKAYFLTYRGGSFDVSVDVGINMSLSLNDLTPDVEYMIEVLVVDKCRSEIFVVFATGEGIQWSFKQQY
jgi:hypothetical protein